MKKLINLGRDFAGGMGDRHLMVYAASGCYYMFMSLVPLLMIICCILPYTPLTEDLMLSYIDTYFSPSLGRIVADIIAAIYDAGKGTLTVSILLTLYSASASMKAVMRGINAAYDAKRKENFFIFSARALVYMVVMLLAAILSFVGMVYGHAILQLILDWVPGTEILRGLFAKISRLRFIAVMAFLVVAFTLLYKAMPARPVKLLRQIPGAVFAAAMWMAFSAIYSWYVSFSDKYGAYGFIGTIMVAMLWIYYCLFFLLVGGYLNSFLSNLSEEGRTAEE